MADASGSQFWEKAAPVMRVVGAILLAAGMIHLYADQVIFDAPTFGSRTALSLGDPRVSRFVAEQAHALDPRTPLHFEHHLPFEADESCMCQIKRDADAGDAVG